jgi:hypothetical protein
MQVEGIVVDGGIKLSDGCPFPEGTKVVVIPGAVEGPVASPPGSTVGQRLLKHAGTVKGLPHDLAAQHDHYLHGVPKR